MLPAVVLPHFGWIQMLSAALFEILYSPLLPTSTLSHYADSELSAQPNSFLGLEDASCADFKKGKYSAWSEM